jgi:hypothetical protein
MTATLPASLGAAQDLYYKASLLLEQQNVQDALLLSQIRNKSILLSLNPFILFNNKIV